jgi:hypothetical protein
MVRFSKLEYLVLVEQKLTWLKKMIATHRVPMMTMMILMMNMMIKSSCWSFKNHKQAYEIAKETWGSSMFSLKAY